MFIQNYEDYFEKRLSKEQSKKIELLAEKYK